MLESKILSITMMYSIFGLKNIEINHDHVNSNIKKIYQYSKFWDKGMSSKKCYNLIQDLVSLGTYSKSSFVQTLKKDHLTFTI
jgi:hypothetical protein